MPDGTVVLLEDTGRRASFKEIEPKRPRLTLYEGESNVPVEKVEPRDYEIIEMPSGERIILEKREVQRNIEEIGEYEKRILEKDEYDIYLIDEFKLKLEREKTVNYGHDILNDEVITPRNFKILVEWLLQIKYDKPFEWSTYFLAIYILRVFLSKKKIDLSRLQLVGITSLFIASKIEEKYKDRPTTNYWIWVTDHSISKPELLQTEEIILRIIEWTLSVPTPYTFLEMFLHLLKSSLRNEIKYYATDLLAELSKRVEYTHYLPSDLALACISHVITYLNKEEKIWNNFVEKLDRIYDYDISSSNYKKALQWIQGTIEM